MSEDVFSARRAKLENLRESGDPYPNDFKPDHKAGALCDEHGEKSREQLADEKPSAKVAGRIMLRRMMGKAVFLTLQDVSRRLQVYVNRDAVGDDVFSQMQDWDIGDIIGVGGTLFKTKTGELSLRAADLRLLVKSLRPLPEKFHGLTDSEMRYRQRYVSLTANAKEREIFQVRAAIIRYLRDFFHERDYLEVETPILQPIPGGAVARPFVTDCNALGCKFYLRIAQELYLKRLLVGGLERVFEINRNFRNEGVSTRHNPEFTMLEYNAAYEDCESYMALTEGLLHGLVVFITGGEEIAYQGGTISFARPFARLSPLQAIRKCRKEWSEEQLEQRDFLIEKMIETKMESRLAGGEEDAMPESREEFVKTMENKAIDELQFMLFEKCAEQSLIQPTFLVDYPASLSPLSKRRAGAPAIADRFELFAAGRELVNGFSEQNDPDVQAAVFAEQAKLKAAGDDEAMHYDSDYVRALEYGLPPNAGGGIGVDRLTMLLTDTAAIRDVILFPQLRPEN